MSPKDLSEHPEWRFCNAPGGGTVFGYISPVVSQALGVPAWPIKLHVGVPGQRGWGKAHIETAPGRMRQIQSLGLYSVERLVALVAENYHRVCDSGNGKISIVYRYLEHDLALVLWPNPEGFWSVTTGLPYRIHRQITVWEKTQTGRSESPP